MERKLPQRHKVFLFGVLVGLISLFAFWTIIFTTLSGGVKFSVFLGSAALSVVIQVYALRELKKPGFWQRYNWSAFQQEIRNYRWFGIFLFGVFSPLIFSFFWLCCFEKLITNGCSAAPALRAYARQFVSSAFSESLRKVYCTCATYNAPMRSTLCSIEE